MRIIGGKDYYDSATAQYGFDSSTTFVRKASLVPMGDTPMHYSSRQAGDYYLYRFEVVVAGEIHKCLRVTKSTAWGQPRYATRYIYDQAEATAFAPTLPQYFRDWCDLSVSEARREAIKSWALDNKVTVAISGAEPREVSEYNRHGYELFDNYNRKYSVLINSDSLKAVEFYRVLPPAEAHRAIASWVGGVLPYNYETVQLSDRSRIQKAGFDIRTSFRKAKA